MPTRACATNERTKQVKCGSRCNDGDQQQPPPLDAFTWCPPYTYKMRCKSTTSEITCPAEDDVDDTDWIWMREIISFTRMQLTAQGVNSGHCQSLLLVIILFFCFFIPFTICGWHNNNNTTLSNPKSANHHRLQQNEVIAILFIDYQIQTALMYEYIFEWNKKKTHFDFWKFVFL